MRRACALAAFVGCYVHTDPEAHNNKNGRCRASQDVVFAVMTVTGDTTQEGAAVDILAVVPSRQEVV